MCETCPTCGRRVTKPKARKPLDGDEALFASYEATAPRLDLEVYLARAERLQLDARAKAIVAQMLELHDRIIQMGDNSKAKGRVWALIGAFKAATISWTNDQPSGGTPMRLPLPTVRGEKETLKAWEHSPLMKAAKRDERAS